MLLALVAASCLQLTAYDSTRFERPKLPLHTQSIGDATIREDSRLAGDLPGSVTVFSGAHLDFDGVIARQLILRPRAYAVVHGVIGGDVLVDGGSLAIFGKHHGAIRCRRGGALYLPQRDSGRSGR